MESTVGWSCVNCRQPIDRPGVAIFCPGCGCPCHLACGRPQGPEMSNYSCLTCGAPRAEVARFKTEREYRLVTQLAGHQAAPKTPLEGRHKVWLVVGAIFMLLGIIRFGLAVSGIDVPVLGSLFLALIPFLIGFVICCIALQRAHRIGW